MADFVFLFGAGFVAGVVVGLCIATEIVCHPSTRQRDDG